MAGCAPVCFCGDDVNHFPPCSFVLWLFQFVQKCQKVCAVERVWVGIVRLMSDVVYLMKRYIIISLESMNIEY